MRLKEWLPYIAQAFIVIGAAWTYSSAMERRLTVLEVQMKTQLTLTEKIVTQMEQMAANQARIIAIEEFLHRDQFVR